MKTEHFIFAFALAVIANIVAMVIVNKFTKK